MILLALAIAVALLLVLLGAIRLRIALVNYQRAVDEHYERMRNGQ